MRMDFTYPTSVPPNSDTTLPLLLGERRVGFAHWYEGRSWFDIDDDETTLKHLIRTGKLWDDFSLTTFVPGNGKLGFANLVPKPFVRKEDPEALKLVDKFDGKSSYQELAKDLLYNYIKGRLEKTDSHVAFDRSEIYVVWFCKTLQNWKVLASTTLPDGMYYEITYNGDKNEVYIDAYKKWDNVRIPLNAFRNAAAPADLAS